jgi:hypothetical protein
VKGWNEFTFYRPTTAMPDHHNRDPDFLFWATKGRSDRAKFGAFLSDGKPPVSAEFGA